MLQNTRTIDASDRLGVLRGAPIDTRGEEGHCEQVTALAARIFEVPDAFVSPLDANEHWLRHTRRHPVDADPPADTYQGLQGDAPGLLVIEDTRADPAFAAHPLVTGPPAIRFYAGQPLNSPSGARLGTLCLVDYRPRMFGARDRDLLAHLARLAENEMRVSRLAITDELTGLFNRRGFERVCNQVLETCRRTGRSAALLYFDLNGFKRINDTLGHATGDMVLECFSRLLEQNVRSSDVVGRLGGDEFVVLLGDAEPESVARSVARLRLALKTSQRLGDAGLEVSFSCGTADFEPRRHADCASLVAEADGSMYADKHADPSCPFGGPDRGCSRPPETASKREGQRAD